MEARTQDFGDFNISSLADALGKRCRLLLRADFWLICRQNRGHEGQNRVRNVDVSLINNRENDHNRIPDKPHPDPSKRKISPAEMVNEFTASEIDYLDQLTLAGCTSTPHLIDFQQFTQSEDFWMPGGYMVCIVMEDVPGISLEDFWLLEREKRDGVRQAFQSALESVNPGYPNIRIPDRGLEVWKLRLNPADHIPQNLIWDRPNQKW